MDRRDRDELQSKLSSLHREIDEIRGRDDAEKAKLELALRALDTKLQRKESEFDQLKLERDNIVSTLRADLDNEKSRRDKETSQVGYFLQ